MVLIIWRIGSVMGAFICFLVLFAAFTLPFVWHSPRLAFWYKAVGPVAGVIISIGAVTLALRK